MKFTMAHAKKFAAAMFSGISAFAVSGTFAFAQSGLQNPLRSQSIAEFIASALKVLVIVALPIITLFIVISGFMFVLARGNESRLTEAKKNFVYVIIGALLILGAWVIATLIGGAVTQLVGN